MTDRRTRLLFQRMAARADIRRRWSTLRPAKVGFNESLDDEGFYASGNFPSTGARMRKYEREAPSLAAKAVNRLIGQGGSEKITHLIVTSCTGFAAPGVDFEIIRLCKLESSIERTVIGFMGCNAAINALKLARHIVRSEPDSRVLIVSVELCTLHLQESERIEQLLSFLLFGDGCAAAIVSADPHGFSLELFPRRTRTRRRGPDHLGHRRFRFRHGPLRPGSHDDRRRAQRGFGTHPCRAGEQRISDVGNSSWRPERARRS